MERHTISKKALQKQGPMPTDRGLKRIQAVRAKRETGTSRCRDRTAAP